MQKLTSGHLALIGVVFFILAGVFTPAELIACLIGLAFWLAALYKYIKQERGRK